ncbi:unnamed protein product, partial [Ectocarpus sp. 8 AP-2014]
VDSGKITIFSGLPASPPSSAAQGVDAAKGAALSANASGASFEFLSATFGATLPRGHVSVVPSLPEDACQPIAPLAAVSGSGGSRDGGRGVGGRGGDVAPVAVLVKRGACSFGVKAKNVQEAGGRVIIFHDNGLGVLQNVGAPDPLAKELFIPGVFVTARAGDSLVAANNNNNGQDGKGMGPLTVTFDPDNAIGRAWGALGATQWPNDLLEARVLARQLRATHASSPCRTKWVDDKVRRAEGLPTDAGTPSEQAATTAAATVAVAPEAGEVSATGTLPRKTAAVLKDTGGVEEKATIPEKQRPSTQEEEEEEEEEEEGQRGSSEQEPCSSEEVSPEVANGVDGVRGAATVGGEGEGEVERGSCKEKMKGEGEGERRGGLKEL